MVTDIDPQNAFFAGLGPVFTELVGPIAGFFRGGSLLFVIIAGGIGVIVFHRLTRSRGQ